MLDEGKWFYFAGGRSAKSLEDLADALKHIPDTEFVFHVNSAKNDFANWVEGVFEEHELAGELRHVMERRDTIRLLEQFLHRKKSMEKKHSEEAAKSALEHAAPDFTPEPAKAEAAEDEEKDAVEEPVPVGSEEAPLKLEGEKELSQNDLKEIVEETRQELEIEGRHVDEDSDTSILGKVSRMTGYSKLDDKTKFIIKEFIFGFVLGLIFGLIMLGALLNVKCY